MGATLGVVLKLYSALVQPILEYACAVWDGEHSRSKKQLDGVQRAALLAATRAQTTTSSAALEVYCNVESLQLRRNFISAAAYQTILRLEEVHPVSKQLKEWIESGRPYAKHSLFPRALSLCSSLYRFAGCSYDLDKAVEVSQIQSQKKPLGAFKPHLSKQCAKLEQRKLCDNIQSNDNILRIYTDGSAIPNPGRIGLGVCMVASNFKRTISEPLGFGSNISAELCAVRTALGEALSLVGRYKEFHLFCDCFIAVQWANGRSQPSSDYHFVSDIRELLDILRKHSNVFLSWVPAHVGVPGNEEANTAAQEGAEDVVPGTNYKDEPLVPYGVARATLKRGTRKLARTVDQRLYVSF